MILYEEGHINKDWIPEETMDFVTFLSKKELQAKAVKAGIQPKLKDWKDERELRLAKLCKEYR